MSAEVGRERALKSLTETNRAWGASSRASKNLWEGVNMKRILAVVTITALLVVAMVAPALAAKQSGLVNVQIGDVIVAVPVAVAANICGVDVNVVATQFVGTEEVVCVADADAMAEVPPPFRPPPRS